VGDGSAKLLAMTRENRSRRILVGAGIGLLGAAVVVRELVRSGAVAGDLFGGWLGEIAAGVACLAVSGVAVFLFDRAYRRRD
jgi:hypothetical protein